jgi:NAD(P)-dependent dehydrogenase (short-subunit alcohol dehydrogenase family)
MYIKGCVALVTGANRGIGLAFAKGLLAGGAGKVYAGTRDPGKITTPDLLPIKLDVTRQGDIDAAAKACPDVTLLVNNAGITATGNFLSPGGIGMARAQFETNFFGTLAMCRAFAPILKANGGGAVVNMLSVLSWVNVPAVAMYCASKSAAWALTNGLRNELRLQGTLVVAVHAAFVDTDMSRAIPFPKIKPEEVVQQTLKGLQDGTEEILADPFTRKVKNGLAAEQAPYLREAGR